MKLLKNIALSLLTGANVVSIGLMLLVAYSDRINPVAHEVLACAGIFMPFALAANMVFVVVWTVVKWKRLWLPVAGFALCYVPIRTYLPLNAATEPPEDALLLMSYNVAGFGFEKKKEQIDTICTYIQRVKPDIVCLQEESNPARKVMERFGEIFEYNDTVHVNGHTEKYVNVLGVHSHYPILKKETIVYDSSNNGSAAFFLLVGADTIVVVNNHLESTHLSPDERERYKSVLKGEVERDSVKEETSLLVHKVGRQMALRAPQADAVHRYVEAHGSYPVIVCGDFNDTPISYARRTIAKGLTDCFAETGCGFGLSYNQKGFFFRIDHILCSAHFAPYGCKVDSEIKASDHYPVLCWLKKVDKP